jgi:primosomal protein N' (replication factor Y)
MRGALTARVAIAQATRGYDREYDYLVPEALAGRAEAGARVVVPFGAKDRERYAVILEVRVSVPASARALKSILNIPDSAPLLREKDIALAAYMRKRYFCTWFEAFCCMLPRGWEKKSDRAAAKTVKAVRPAVSEREIRAAIAEFRVNREQQIRVLELVLAHCPDASADWPAAANDPGPATALFGADAPGPAQDSALGASVAAPRPPGLPVRRLAAEAGVSDGVVATLVRNGYLEYVAQKAATAPIVGAAAAPPGDTAYGSAAGVLGDEPTHRPLARSMPSSERSLPFEPTEEQARALAELTGRLTRGGFSETLLHGVTGSGKTEVYLQLISRALALGRQAIVLVPEISLTPQMMERFWSRFVDRIAIFHSRLADGERADQWCRVRAGEASIAVGARSAVFAPFSNLGVIVIDEEHEASYKSEMRPRYHAAEIARFRGESHGALLVYGSATPSVESYYRAKRGACGLIEMRARTNRLEMPEVLVADMRDELKAGNRSMFSAALAKALRETLAESRQAILFLNRRGFASFLLCRDCGYIVSCRECSASYTYHQEGGRLVCHYCGLTAPVPDACPSCGGVNVRAFGAGTERVEQEVLRVFPGSRVLRMDRDTTSGKDAHSRILGRFRDRKADILIGTQMIAKGHDFPEVTLVGVLAADAILNFSDFRASERTFQLLTQVAGRSGRGEAGGRVVIQTYNPDHYSVAMAKGHDYEGFYRQEMIARRALQYPPFQQIGVLVVTGVVDARVRAAAERLRGVLCAKPREGLTVLGPTRPPIGKLRDRYRWRIVIKDRDEDAVHELLGRASEFFFREKLPLDADLSVDLNPFSML